ncbi:MAG: hypothetical protein NZ866_01305 [Patescibacteria group bacterium]|nr:hypothetical protein [Patescibacteria group bacterium]
MDKKNLIYLIIFCLFLTLFLLKNYTLAQQIPICVAPGNLLVINEPIWRSNQFLMSSSLPGVLNYSPLQFLTNNNLIIASNTWFNLNRGLILSGPSENFNVAGGLYFRDLTKSRGAGNNIRYNEFSIFMPTTTNDLSFFYQDVLNNTSRTVVTISTSGKISTIGEIISNATISANNINISNNLSSNNILANSNITASNNIFSLNRLSIGTTAVNDKLYIYSPSSDQYINLSSANRGNLRIGTLFNPSEAIIRFKEIFKIFYGTNTNPILTINNNQRIGINTTTPQVALDVIGDIKSSRDIIAQNGFCLGTNCIYSWQSIGGNIGGSGSFNYLPRWISNNTLANSVLQQISYSYNNANFTGIENRSGAIIAPKFCIRTANNDLSCLTSWPHRPAVAHFYPYIIGHRYWENFLSSLINTSIERNVSNQDPYIRPGTNNYDQNLGRGYPYLRLHDIINRIGVDPDNEYATKWFILGYAYRQVFANLPTALFIKEGDNLNPWTRYTKTTSSPGGLNPHHPDDVFIYCHYYSPNGAIYVIDNRNICDEIRDNQRQGYAIIGYTYVNRYAPIKGFVKLEISLEPANQRTICTRRDYLNSMLIFTWGHPSVINLRVSNYRYPYLTSTDPCFDNGMMPNLHSLIMGRFIVEPYPTSNTSSPNYVPPTPITNFLNNSNANFTVVVESLGIVELIQY